jgi:hypothetical protein
VRLGIFLVFTTFAPDASAWGLQTHVFIAQWALAALPLADPQFRAAALRLPRLVLAGACLPDLALAGRILGLSAFQCAHRWSTLRRLATACWDEERAIAVGYASHLLADVVAHNRFVPEHERRIADIPHVTHALCEWAMDEHVKAALEVEPAALLSEDVGTLSEAAARTFRCGQSLARRGILFLSRAERMLRLSRLPQLCRAAAAAFDSRQYFDAYVGDAKLFVRQVDAVLRGIEPRGQPEPDQETAKEAPAMSAPSAPPASTSLG